MSPDVQPSDRRPIVERAEIAAGLADLGIARGDVALVHSSLKSFGYVVGGADAVIDALLDVVGPVGTVAVPTLSYPSFEPERPSFDARTTPSETGRITEVFR